MHGLNKDGRRLRHATVCWMSKRLFVLSGGERKSSQRELPVQQQIQAHQSTCQSHSLHSLHSCSGHLRRLMKMDFNTITRGSDIEQPGTLRAYLKDTAMRMLLRNSSWRIGRSWRKASLA